MERRFPTCPWSLAWLALWMGMALAACSDDRQTYSESSGEYLLAMRTDPEPPEVGKSAVVTVTLHRQGSDTLEVCPVKLREYPIDQPPADGDESGYSLMRQDGLSRIYRSDSRVFDHVGKWVFDFKVKCEKTKFRLQIRLFVAKAG